MNHTTSRGIEFLSIVDFSGKSGYIGHSFNYWSGNLILVDRKTGFDYAGYDLGGCSCVIFRGADLIIYDTGESTEEVHQGSAEIRLFTEEVTQWTVYILWFVKSNLY